MLLKNKVAVIYGAGGAIGGAVARAFARECHRCNRSHQRRGPTHLAEHLLSAGHAVRVVACNAEKLRSLAERGADVRTGAFSDRAFLSTVFEGASAAFLLTPVNLFAPDGHFVVHFCS